jgi:hypothetical protein
LENVISFQTGSKNLPVLLRQLKEFGYVVTSHVSSPHAYGIPQHRSRLWVLAVDARLMTQAEIDTTGQTISSLKIKSPRAMMPFDRFLLDDSHPHVLQELQHLTESKRLAEKRQMSATSTKTMAFSADSGDAKWVLQHFSAVRNASVLNPKRWGSNNWNDPAFCAAHPWFSLLHDRQRYCLINAEFENHGANINVDLSQGIDRQSYSKRDKSPDAVEMVNCVTPEGKIWNTRRCRLLLGEEKLALQCVFPEPDRATGFGGKLQSDLAGNIV